MRKPWKPSTSLLRALEAAPWRFARTYPDAPHWYVTEHHAPALVARMREAIARYGYWGAWRGRRYRYLDVGGWKYWWVPPALNREPLKGGGEYVRGARDE